MACVRTLSILTDNNDIIIIMSWCSSQKRSKNRLEEISKQHQAAMQEHAKIAAALEQQLDKVSPLLLPLS